METGALVMMDALGFRDLWRTQSAESIVTKLAFLKSDAEAYHATQIAGQSPAGNVIEKVTVQFLSDTVILTVTTRPPPDEVARLMRLDPAVFRANSAVATRAAAVVFAAAYASRLMQVALETSLPVVYRGCIAFGEFFVSGNFLIGRAVDEAATYHEAANGAFVWLLPSAYDAMGDHRTKTTDDDTRILRHRVPLRDGTSVDTLVATPFFGITRGASPDQLRRRALSAFDRNRQLGVVIKRQNTDALLVEAVRRTEAARTADAPQAETVAALPIPPALIVTG